MSDQHGLVGVDIGTSTIKVVVSESEEDNLKIKAAIQFPSAGICKGQVVDAQKAIESLRKALATAEKKSGQALSEAIISISGQEVQSIINRGSLLVSRINNRVTEWDVVRVLECARQAAVPAGTDIVCVVPRSFFVDGRPTAEPIGSEGQLLEVEALLITSPHDLLEQKINIVKAAGISIRGVTAGIMGTAAAVLAPGETGVAVIDIGAVLTDIALLDNGGLCWLKSLPVGGEYITKDISFGLQVSSEKAEEIKLKHASLISPQIGETICLTSLQSEKRKINKSFLNEIIDSRLTEIFQLIKTAVVESGHNEKLQKGLIFTGGVTEIPGFLERAEECLDVPVRLGRCTYGWSETPDGNFSCAAGLIQCFESGHIHQKQAASGSGKVGIVERIGKLFKKIL